MIDIIMMTRGEIGMDRHPNLGFHSVSQLCEQYEAVIVSALLLTHKVSRLVNVIGTVVLNVSGRRHLTFRMYFNTNPTSRCSSSGGLGDPFRKNRAG